MALRRVQPSFQYLTLRTLVGGMILLTGLGGVSVESSAEATQTDRERLATRRSAGQAMGLKALRLTELYQRADRTQRAALRQALRTTLLERKALLLGLLKDNPSTVTELALPEETPQRLPAGLAELVEHEERLAGMYQLLVIDSFDERSTEIQHHLRTPQGQRRRLRFAHTRPAAAPGSAVEITGLQLDSELLVEEMTAAPQAIAKASSTPALQTTTNRVAVILFNFLNDTRQPITPDAMRHLIFTDPGGVNSYYQEASFGSVSLEGALNVSGDVFGWYTIAHQNTPCQTNTSWTSAARAAAGLDGFDFSRYRHVIYFFPKTPACNWAGMGEVPGQQSWINGYLETTFINHELGHNYGLLHANVLRCVDQNNQPVPFSETCTEFAYADPFDTMGNLNPGHFSNYQKNRVGYLAPHNIQTIEADGTYTLEPIEVLTNGVQTLKIQEIPGRHGEKGFSYYLEFRQPIGQFDNYTPTSPVFKGVSIRRALPWDEPVLLDTASQTTTFWDAALPVGKTFTDASASIEIRTQQVSPSAAMVAVSFGTQCLGGAPELTVSPTAQWGQAGEELDYEVTVTNMDGSRCAPATATVTPTAPLGWAWEPATLQMTLPPGEEESFMLTVTSPETTPEGFYTVDLQASSSTAPELVTNAQAGYNVQAGGDHLPIIKLLKPKQSLQTKKYVWISARAAQSTEKVDKVKLYMDGQLLKTCARKNPHKKQGCRIKVQRDILSLGTHTITATASTPGATPATASVTTQIVVE